MTIKNKIIGAIAFGIGVIGVSCNNVPNSPGWEYMPDMYRSTSYETNSGNPNFADSMTNRQPAAGTVSQGWIANSEYSSVKAPYPYKFDSLGYELAGQNLRNPFPASADVVAQGKDKYDKFCVHCHGASGMGDGAVVEFGNFPPPPAYNSTQLKNLPEGKMYHTLQYGKGMMGSHASQLTPEERWKILRYVQTLQNPGGVTGAGRVMVTPPIYPEGAMVDSVGNVIVDSAGNIITLTAPQSLKINADLKNKETAKK